MGQTNTGRYCSHCEKDVMAIKSTPNHILHLLLSLVTLGFWVPVWIVITFIAGVGVFRCTKCGKPI